MKNLYNQEMVDGLTTAIEEVYSGFDGVKFKSLIFDNAWEAKEVKERLRHITLSMAALLPEDFDETIDILKPLSGKFPNGFEYIFFPGFVEVFCADHWEKSMKGLKVPKSSKLRLEYIIQHMKPMAGSLQKSFRSQRKNINQAVAR